MDKCPIGNKSSFVSTFLLAEINLFNCLVVSLFFKSRNPTQNSYGMHIIHIIFKIHTPLSTQFVAVYCPFNYSRFVKALTSYFYIFRILKGKKSVKNIISKSYLNFLLLDVPPRVSSLQAPTHQRAHSEGRFIL